MGRNKIRASLLVWFVFSAFAISNGQSAATSSNPAVPTLVNYSGVLTGPDGKPLTSLTGVTFYLYQDSQAGAPLWMETQNVQPDRAGHYAVILGSTTSQGLPTGLFASGEARWLGVQAQGQAERPRVMLLAVPYALKAKDSETVGGLPASAFVLAAPQTAGSNPAVSPAARSGLGAGPDIGGSGTQNYIPFWSDASSDLGNSILYQLNGTNIGVGTITPAATLDVNGSLISRGALQLPSTGTANSVIGFNSQPFFLQGSAFNSTSGKAIGPVFQWQTEPSGNNTSNPAGTLNLLYGNGSGSPAETGLNITNNGQITFASGQKFPGAGTITGITAGTGLTGGGTSGNITLSINVPFANQHYAQLGAANTFTKNQTVTGSLTATSFSGDGSALTNINAGQLGGLASSAFAQLAAANIFTSPQQFSGNVGIGTAPNTNTWTPLALSGGNSFGTWVTLANTSSGHTWNILSAGSGNSEGAGNLGITDFTGTSKIFLEGNVNVASLTTTGTVNGGVVNAASGFNLAGSPFVTGSYGIVNAFFGFNVGNSTMTGGNNLALGAGTFWQNTTGNQNTALGEFSLFANTTGAQNTATGYNSLSANTSGGYNTADGISTLFSNTTGNANTAAGSLALYLNTTGTGNTASGANALESNTIGGFNSASGDGALEVNSSGNFNTAVGFGALYNNKTGSDNTALGSEAGPDPNSSNLTNATALGANAQVTASNAMVLGSIKGVNGANANTFVGIGTTAPTQSLEVDLGNSLVRGANNYLKTGDTASLFVGDTNSFIQATFGTGITFGVYQVPAAVRINQSSGFVGIGTSAPTNRLTLGQGTGAAVGDGWNTYSSRRWKTHIQTLDDALAKVERLRGVSYELKESGKHEIGVIAEEVGQVVPEVVSYEDNGRDARGVDYSRLTALLIEAVKQQQRQIRTQQKQIRVQQQQILQLNNKVGVLQAASRLVSAATNPERITVATAAKPATDATGTKGEIYASPSR